MAGRAVPLWTLGLGLGVLPAVAAAQGDGSGMKTSASVDLTGDFGATKASAAHDFFGVREAELLIYGPIDHVFDGTMSAAAHRENGEVKFEVHEAHIDSSRLIPRSTIRVGQFFLGVGRLNRFHRHEWPFIFPPRVHAELFGQEGILDDGIEYNFLAPTPFVLNLTLGVTNGWAFGEAGGPQDSALPATKDEGGAPPAAEAPRQPRRPTHYGRVSSYIPLPGKGGAELGLSGLARTDAAGSASTYVGVDFTAKWRAAGILNVLVQSEAWQRSVEPKDGDAARAIGYYVFPQYAWSSEVFIGVLLDYFTVPTLKDPGGARLANSDQRVVPTFTYKASEFSTLRLAYDWEVDKVQGQDDRKNQRYELQATFMLGAHPAHDF